ncbi:MAG: NAD+ synthase [Planctomycetota bacterium]|nr:NAD+ synthase [Planctomycetota bacterium]
MKIALAQMNTTIGAVERNATRCLQMARQAENLGADLVAFPEMTLGGYPPSDLLERKAFLQRNQDALERIAAGCGGIGVVVGYAALSQKKEGKPIHNAAALIEKGKVIGVAYKGLLPTYDVFDEGRHFEPGTSFRPISFRGHRIGLSICEDIWNYEEEGGRRRYACDPVEELAREGVDLFINISASPYAIGRPAGREDVGRAIVKRYGVPIAMVNLVGGNDSLLFDGASYVLGLDGQALGRAARFKEDLLVVDLESSGSMEKEQEVAVESEVIEALTMGLRDYARKCGFKTAILGLSGGIDSSVVCAIAAKALGADQITGVAMPGPYSSDASLEDAEALARAMGIHFAVIPIGQIFDGYREALNGEFAGASGDLAEENVQARVRGNILMALSNRFGHLLLSTGNKSEMAVGYCTLYGDLSGGLAVISDVPKTLVYRLASYLNANGGVIPERVLTKAPSAELRPDQTDQDSLPPYEELDPILQAYIEKNLDFEDIVALGFDREVVRDILDRIERNEYKRRQSPPGLRVTTKAFGIGRRLPIARAFRQTEGA